MNPSVPPSSANGQNYKAKGVMLAGLGALLTSVGVGIIGVPLMIVGAASLKD